MRNKTLSQKIISFISILAIISLFFPVTPKQIPRVEDLHGARAATPGKLTGVSMSANNYTPGASFTLTVTFTTANALSSYGDVIRFNWWDIVGSSASLDSITVDGASYNGVYMNYGCSSYFELYLDTTISAGKEIVATISGLTHYAVATRAERVGIVTFSPSSDGTAYENCTDAGGGDQSYGVCTPFWVFIPFGTPELKGRILGPTGTADQNNGFYGTHVNAWSGNVWNSDITDHLGYFYIYNLATASNYQMDFTKPVGVTFVYSAPNNLSGVSVTEGSTNNLGTLRYKSPSAQGTIVDPNGDPIENVGARYMDVPMPDEMTDSSGKFYLPAISAGTYLVQFSTWMVEESAGLVTPDPISITVDGTTTYNMGTIEFEKANKTIKGYVRYPDGSAVTDAQVGCSKPMGGDWVNTNVNNSGYYELLVGKGYWQCFAEHQYGSYNQEDFDWVHYNMPTPVSFKEDNSVTENSTLNFEVTMINSTITGKVLKPDGTPYTGGGLNIDVFTMMGFGSWNQAEADGSFTVKVPAGTYQIMINLWDSEWGGPSPETITIGADATHNMGTLYLVPKDASISGTITNDQGSGVNNQFMDCFVPNEWGKWANGSTDSNGNYSIKTFGGSTYQCMPMSSYGGWSGEGEDTYLYLGAPQSINLPNTDSSVSGVDFEMTKADATVNVTTVDSNGTTVEVFGFSFIDQGGSAATGGMSGPMMMGPGLGGPINNGTGSFKVPSSMCPSTSPCNVNLSTPPGEGAEWSSAGAVSFSLTSNGTTNVEVVMAPHDATVSGTLKGSDGNAITGTVGSVFADNFETMSFTETRINTVTGGYELTLSAGDYNLGAWVSPELGYVPCGLSDAKVTAVSSSTVTQDLTLCKIDATINVTVLAPNGNPMPGAFVDASTSSGMKKAGGSPGMMGPMMMGPGMMGDMSGSDGTVDVGVPGGSGTTFYVSASLPPEMNYINPSKQTVTIASGETVNVTLQFRESDATISGGTTIDGNTTSAYVTAWSESGGFTEAFSFSGAYTLNVTQGDNWHVNAKSKIGSDFYKSGEKVIEVDETMESLDLSLVLAVSNVPDPVSAAFNANQPAVVALDDGSVTVNIPASSISTTGTDQIKITVAPNYEIPDTDTDKVPTYGVDITAYKNNVEVESQFNSNITVTQCWSEDNMSEMGLTDSDLSSKYWDEEAGAWKSPGTVTTDEDRNCKTSSVNHLTNFAITASELSAPTLSVTSPANNSIVAVNSITVEGTVSDTSATVVIAKGGTSVGTISVNSSTGAFSHLVSGLTAGANTITVDASNGVGDAATVTLNIRYEGSEDDNLGVATGVDSDLVLRADNGSSHIQIWDNQGNLKASFFAYGSAFRGEMKVSTADLDGDGDKEIITSTGNGLAPHVRVFTNRGVLMGQFYAYDSTFRGGVTVKIADVNNDNIADIVTKPVSGGPNIRAYKWNASTSGFELINWFMAYQENFRGELNMTISDVTGDGNNNIILVPKEKGGPNLRVYEYNETTEQFTLVDWFFVYHRGFKGGVNITCADVNGDGTKDIITAPYSSGGPNLRVYTYNSTTGLFDLLDYIMAYGESYRGGIDLKTIDVDSDGDYEIVTKPTIGGPNVRVFTYNSDDGNLELLDWLWVYPSTYRINYDLEVSDVDRDGNREIIVAPKKGGPNVRIYEYDPDIEAFALVDWFMAYAEDFGGGVNLKIIDVNGDGYSDLVTTPYSNGGPNVRIYKWDEDNEKMEIDKWFMGYTSSYRVGITINTIY